jgi:predicted DCC family thiol-disulfide oxidoreductase YuxK
VRWLNNLDALHRLECLNLHDPLARAKIAVPLPDLLREMHVQTHDGKILIGFPAFRRMSRELPLLMPLYPLLWLPGMNRLGGSVYAWIAAHRQTL